VNFTALFGIVYSIALATKRRILGNRNDISQIFIANISAKHNLVV